MIHNIFSSLESFKALTFNSGLNVVLADKSQGATDKQTRNSSGKTSIIAIIHFLLGGACERTSPFRSEALRDESLGMSFDIGRQRITATRSGGAPNRITVDANLPEWPIHPSVDDVTGETVLSSKPWNTALGASVFNVNEASKFSPSFRSMIPYFVRREWDGGFHCADKNTEKQ